MTAKRNDKAGGILYVAIFCFLHAGYVFAAEAHKQDKADAVTLPRVEYKSEGLRDPFEGVFKTAAAAAASGITSQAQPAPAQVSPPSLKVQGIIWGGNMPLAIIDNKVVKVGDTVADARIIAIGKAGVEVIFKNYTFKIPSPADVQLQDLETSSKGGQDEK